MAPGSISFRWEADLESQESGWKEGAIQEVREWIFRMVSRESNLGSTQDPWRASQARLGCLGANDLPLDASSAWRSRASQAVARLPSQPPRSHRRDGFFHGFNHPFPSAGLLLPHGPGPSTHSALQLQKESHRSVNCPAVQGSVSVRVGSEVSPLRPRCERGGGSSSHGSVDENPVCADFVPEFLAERNRGTMDRELPM